LIEVAYFKRAQIDTKYDRDTYGRIFLGGGVCDTAVTVKLPENQYAIMTSCNIVKAHKVQNCKLTRVTS